MEQINNGFELEYEVNNKEQNLLSIKLDIRIDCVNKYLDHLSLNLIELDKDKYNISLNQGMISEDTFIEKIYGKIWKLIFDYPSIDNPNFNLTSIFKTSNQSLITKKLISGLIKIIQEFKSQNMNCKNKDEIIKSFNIFKNNITQCYDIFKVNILIDY